MLCERVLWADYHLCDDFEVFVKHIDVCIHVCLSTQVCDRVLSADSRICYDFKVYLISIQTTFECLLRLVNVSNFGGQIMAGLFTSNEISNKMWYKRIARKTIARQL